MGFKRGGPGWANRIVHDQGKQYIDQHLTNIFKTLFLVIGFFHLMKVCGTYTQVYVAQ